VAACVSGCGVCTECLAANTKYFNVNFNILYV
jgi:hypothetical protein